MIRKTDGSVVFSTPRFNVITKIVSGVQYFYIEKADGVAVVLQNKKREVLLLKVRRINVAIPTWELPGGRIESGERPVDAACKECREETGYEIRAHDMTFFGSIRPLPSLANETIYVFGAAVTQHHKRVEGYRGHEGIIDAQFVDLGGIRKLIRSGKIYSSADVNALALAFHAFPI